MRVIAIVGAAVAMAALGGAASAQSDTDRWVIYDGPGAGAVIATPSGDRDVRTSGPKARTENVALGANGHIGDGSDTNPAHANCDKLHYHGNLFGSGDPAPDGCGWGRVIRRVNATTELTYASVAYMEEIAAHSIINVLAGAPFAAGDARKQLLAAADNTLEFLFRILTHGTVPISVLQLVTRIRMLDREAADALRNIAEGRGDRAEHHRIALQKLADAFVLKRQLMTELVRHGLVVHSACTKSGGRFLTGRTRSSEVIHGTPRRDVICAGPGNDRISAGGGNDVVIAGGGADVVNGGPGNDTIYGGPGVDRIIGGPGNDRIDTGAGRDRVEGGPGRDTVDGKRDRP